MRKMKDPQKITTQHLIIKTEKCTMMKRSRDRMADEIHNAGAFVRIRVVIIAVLAPRWRWLSRVLRFNFKPRHGQPSRTAHTTTPNST